MRSQYIMDKYGVTPEEMILLKNLVDINTITDIDMIIILSQIKLLKRRLMQKGFAPTIKGCMEYTRSDTEVGVVDKAIRNM